MFKKNWNYRTCCKGEGGRECLEYLFDQFAGRGKFFSFPPSEEQSPTKCTDWTLDVVFSRFRGFSFTITLRQKPKGVPRMLSLFLVIRRCLRGTPLGFFLRVIVNEKPLNLKRRHLVSYLWIKGTANIFAMSMPSKNNSLEIKKKLIQGFSVISRWLSLVF